MKLSDEAEAETKKSLHGWSKKDLLSLPNREWQEESVYDSLLLLSTGKKHDSGWAVIAIVGVRKGVPIELATACSDDIEWVLPLPIMAGRYPVGQFRMDCVHKSGALHAWARTLKFKVGSALSSITITIESIEK